jgi:hypothetical protein
VGPSSSFGSLHLRELPLRHRVFRIVTMSIRPRMQPGLMIVMRLQHRSPLLPGILLLASMALFSGPLNAQPKIEDVLTRLAEEAELFLENAPKTLTRETLEQRALLPPSRFRLRVAEDTTDANAVRMQIRKVVSEYTVAPLKGSNSNNVYEFRQVVGVDGRTVQSEESARHALSLGVQSADDRVRKRMLESFARNGLVDIATDYGLILLAFSKREQQNVRIRPRRPAFVGADEAYEFTWEQTSNAAGVLEFQGKMVARRALRGRLWVRAADGLLLRVESWFQHADLKKQTVRDEATVDYARSSHGFLVPASVHHVHLVNGEMITENLYQYEPFKRFGADAEIKFTEVPDPPAATPPTTKK